MSARTWFFPHLDLHWEERYSAETFITGESNLHVVEWLKRPLLWPKNQLILSGRAKSGKSHLSRIWAEEFGAQIVSGDITQIQINGPFVIDSADTIPEESQLKFLFSLSTTNCPVLWIINTDLEQPFKTEDMKTRMKTLISVTIEPPTEELFGKILQKRCEDFGLRLQPEIVEYFLKRAPIDYTTIDKLAKIMHMICLMSHRNITIDVATEAVQRLNALE